MKETISKFHINISYFICLTNSESFQSEWDVERKKYYHIKIPVGVYADSTRIDMAVFKEKNNNQPRRESLDQIHQMVSKTKIKLNYRYSFIIHRLEVDVHSKILNISSQGLNIRFQFSSGCICIFLCFQSLVVRY